MKVIYYEGLLGVFGKWLEKAFIAELQRVNPHWHFERRHWADRRIIDDPYTIVMGHSFGGVAATRNTKNCFRLFTFDPRVTCFTRLYSRVGFKQINFYQTKALAGVPVYGARNNLILNTTHTDIFFAEKVVEEMRHQFLVIGVADDK